MAAVVVVLLAAGGLYFHDRRRKLKKGDQRGSVARGLSEMVSIKRSTRGSVPPPPTAASSAVLQGHIAGGSQKNVVEAVKVKEESV